MNTAMSVALTLLTLLVPVSPGTLTKPISCDACEDWNRPQEPFRLFGNTHYVGVKGLSAVLVTTPQGSILIDAGLPQSVPLIVDGIEKVGGKVEDLKWILISHAHYDHVGGVAALAQQSGARVAATPHAAGVLRAGMVGKDDPQWGFGEAMRFPPVRRVVEVRDGARIKLGGVTLTMHATPGHTPGGSSWTWRTCEGERCANIVYADSLNAVAAPGFRFTDDPRRVKQFRRTIDRVRKLACDILVPAHPHLAGLLEKQAARIPEVKPDPLFDPAGCRTYAAAAGARLDKRLAEERGEAGH